MSYHSLEAQDQTLWVSLSWRFLRIIGVKGLSGRFSPDDWLSHSTIKTDEWRQAGVLFMINNKCSPTHKMLIDTASSGFLPFQWLKSPLTERLPLRSGLKWVPKPFQHEMHTYTPPTQAVLYGRSNILLCETPAHSRVTRILFMSILCGYLCKLHISSKEGYT